MKKNLLITRPQEEAVELACLLEARGFRCQLAPVLRYELYPLKPDAAGFDGVVLTSARSVHAAVHMPENTAFYVVGESTRAKLIAAGFHRITHAETVDALLPLLPAQSQLLYLRGKHTRYNLKTRYQAGCIVEQEVYCMHAATELDEATKHALQHTPPDGVLLLSARTAQVFYACIMAAALPELFARSTAIVFSKAIQDACPLPFDKSCITPAPTHEALLATLDKWADEG